MMRFCIIFELWIKAGWFVAKIGHDLFWGTDYLSWHDCQRFLGVEHAVPLLTTKLCKCFQFHIHAITLWSNHDIPFMNHPTHTCNYNFILFAPVIFFQRGRSTTNQTLSNVFPMFSHVLPVKFQQKSGLTVAGTRRCVAEQIPCRTCPDGFQHRDLICLEVNLTRYMGIVLYIYIFTSTYIYICLHAYTRIYRSFKKKYIYTCTHTYIYICMYIHTYVCVCVYVCEDMF